jgi:hypothetical protein
MNLYMGSTQRHGWLTCPACGYRVDASSFVGEEADDDHVPPVDGDLSVCMACASVNVYAFGATCLRSPTADERAAFSAELEVNAAVQSVIEAKDRYSRTWPKGPGPI